MALTLIYLIAQKHNVQLQLITLLQMKPSNSFSFSSEENRIDFQYKPESHILSSTNLQYINSGQPFYERSLSSSFLPLINQNNFLSVCQSLSILGDEQIQSQRKSSSISNVKIQHATKLQHPEPSSIMDLQLDFLVSNNKKNSTKNVLRNFGNAQNQFVLYNQRAQEYLDQKLEDKAEFSSWVRKLRLINFEDYQTVWSVKQGDSMKQKLFKRLYKVLCWRFYQQQSIPYIFNSRMNNDNKKAHILQLYKMLRGIIDSKQFEGFKQ